MQNEKPIYIFLFVIFLSIAFIFQPIRIVGEEISLPVQAVIVKDGNFTSERNVSNVQKIFSAANGIWKTANISFDVEVIESSSDEKILQKTLAGNGQEIFNEKNFAKNKINIYFVHNLTSEGVTFSQQKTIFIKDFTNSIDYVVVAHELGHIFDLPHTSDMSRLMFAHCNGTALTHFEIRLARVKAAEVAKEFQEK